MIDQLSTDRERLAPTPPSQRAVGVSATARRVLDLPDPVQRSDAGAAAHSTLERVGGPVGLAAAAAPTVAFVAADAAAGLGTGLVALGVTAVAACGVRLARRESPGAAVAGLVVAALCAGVAAFAGEARAFFLPTMVVPALFVVAHVVMLLARRPLIGLMVNPLSGGPRDWRSHPGLLRTYTISSLIALAMATANLFARVGFYLADQPGILAVAQVVATSAFAVHYAVTLVVARRVAGATTTPRPVPTSR
ncbi:DUF3159 domain-containing protein [Auraticoccus monumenti]|uniref:Intracellular septation protein A n=1 Tax=Auraticoccus monumenti TaxID=675864 RepID=A0A1G6TK42_9ACTN|nr:DUF3159 domain-containing protein [Auraticoccus monumenti]SDD28876.1 Protein of unknown function [Auraticoccus monumenti]